jgi:hypothetical protein
MTVFTKCHPTTERIQVTGSCEGNKSSGFINGMELLDQLNDYQLIKDCNPRRIKMAPD